MRLIVNDFNLLIKKHLKKGGIYL